MVLLDCSKLQLGRGRRDDSVAAFRRRLEVFRELSLPMLKTLDQDQRLVIVSSFDTPYLSGPGFLQQRIYTYTLHSTYT